MNRCVVSMDQVAIVYKLWKGNSPGYFFYSCTFQELLVGILTFLLHIVIITFCHELLTIINDHIVCYFQIKPKTARGDLRCRLHRRRHSSIILQVSTVALIILSIIYYFLYECVCTFVIVLLLCIIFIPTLVYRSPHDPVFVFYYCVYRHSK